MRGMRTPAWQIVVGIGFGLLLLAWLDPGGAVHLGPFDLPAGLTVLVVAFLVATAGLLWISQILRGAGEDEPPPWRYRSH